MQLALNFPDLNIIGLGAQDSLAEANEFVTLTGTTAAPITMVWDPSFDTWRSFGIRSQPYWILYDGQGELVSSSPGAIDFEAVTAAL
ncbi:MAG: hypothetical protein AAF567_17110 [Actinomycetota bacterium]